MKKNRLSPSLTPWDTPFVLVFSDGRLEACPGEESRIALYRTIEDAKAGAASYCSRPYPIPLLLMMDRFSVCHFRVPKGARRLELLVTNDNIVRKAPRIRD